MKQKGTNANDQEPLKATDYIYFICDQIADILHHGGHPKHVEQIIAAAVGHWSRNTSSAYDDPLVVDTNALVLISEVSPRFKRTLKAVWDQRSRPRRGATPDGKPGGNTSGS